jgi:hypothetical protein
MPELRKPKSKIVWRPAFQQQEREHKSPAAWVNDMMIESKDG